MPFIIAAFIIGTLVSIGYIILGVNGMRNEIELLKIQLFKGIRMNSYMRNWLLYFPVRFLPTRMRKILQQLFKLLLIFVNYLYIFLVFESAVIVLQL